MTGNSEKEIQEIKIALLGIPKTADKGMYQDVKDLKDNILIIRDDLRQMNGKVTSNTAWRKALVAGVGLATSGFIAALVLILEYLAKIPCP